MSFPLTSILTLENRNTIKVGLSDRRIRFAKLHDTDDFIMYGIYDETHDVMSR